jgi:hypothetical protein
MIDYLGDVGATLESGDPAELQKLYEALRLEMIYHADEKAVDAEIRLGSARRVGNGAARTRPNRPARAGRLGAPQRPGSRAEPAGRHAARARRTVRLSRGSPHVIA